MSQRPTHLGTPLLVMIGLCVLAAAMLFVFRAAELSGMSTGFTDGAARGEFYFFSHHLLYQPINTLLSATLRPVGCDAFCSAQVHGIFWAVLTVGSAYLITLHLTRSVGTALFAGLLLLFSHNVWVFATQAEPYLPLVGINALLAAIIILNGPRPWGVVLAATVTVLFTFSLFLHQANVFFLLPLTLYLGLTQGRPGLVKALQVTVIAGIGSLAAFVLAYRMSVDGPTLRGFYLWLTYYGVISDDTHGSWRALLTLDPARLKETGRSIVATIITEPSDTLRKPVRLLVMPLLAAAALWNLLSVLRKRPGSEARLFLLAWAGIFILFFAWWHSDVHKFFMFSVMPLLLLLVLALADVLDAVNSSTRRLIGILAVLALGTTAAVNFQHSVRPLMGDGSGIKRVSGKLADARPNECVLYSKRRFGGYLGLVHGLDGRGDFRHFQMMYMSFHFGKFNPELEQTLGYPTDVNVDECNVILLNWLSYEDFQWKGGRGMRRAREATADEMAGPNWPEFIGWFFDVQPAPDGDGILHDEFVFFRAGDDETYVRINRRNRVRAESLDALLELLDRAIEEDPSIEFTRQEHRALNRFRNRVFGYS